MIDVVIGKDTSLSCIVDGIPSPQVFWYKNGNQIESEGDLVISDRGQTLTIERITVC